jgi:cytosine/adenosine deaminase-related metal-dependent hydrolase
MSAFSLRARWVVPVDRPPIAGGFVTTAEGRIADVGAGPPPSGPVEDLGDAALLPGWVNAHTHLEFSDLAKPLGQSGMSLPAWIRLVISERKRRDHQAEAAIAAGLAESHAAGITTIGEIRTGVGGFKLADDCPIRPRVLAFQESIGFSAQRVDSAFADVRQRLLRTAAPAGLSPHAPYTVHPALLDRIVELAIERGAPVAMHLAETPEELRLLATGDGPFRDLLEERGMWDGAAMPRGSAPFDYLRRLAAAQRALVIHGNYLTGEEIAFLGARRSSMSVVYCPRTHAYFGHAAYPLEAMRSAGVRVALGTDSRASTPDLNLLAELRCAAGEFPRVAPADWVRMATLDGADALGLGGQIGSLTPGKRADIVAVTCEPAADPCAALVSGEGGVARVWIAGREVA